MTPTRGWVRNGAISGPWNGSWLRLRALVEGKWHDGRRLAVAGNLDGQFRAVGRMRDVDVGHGDRALERRRKAAAGDPSDIRLAGEHRTVFSCRASAIKHESDTLAARLAGLFFCGDQCRATNEISLV